MKYLLLYACECGEALATIVSVFIPKPSSYSFRGWVLLDFLFILHLECQLHVPLKEIEFLSLF